MRPGPPRNQPASPLAPATFERLEPRCLCAADLGGSLIAHWTFEDPAPVPASFADVSPEGNDHAATPVGDASSITQNRHNQVLQLDGSGDALGVGNSTDINLGIQPQRSVAFWFRADDVSLTTRKQVIFEEGGTTRGLVIYVYDRELYVGGWNTPGGESGWSGTWLQTPGIDSGRWHHVALTLDGQATTTPNALSGYLDGQRFATGEGSQLWEHSGSITVGNHSDGTRFHDGNVGSFVHGFAGQLDEGRIYNRVLDPTEVTLLARGPAATTAPGFTLPPKAPVHDLEYRLTPLASLPVDENQPPQRLNATQTPDFPGRALQPPTPEFAHQQPTESAEPSVADVWKWTANPVGLWADLSRWLVDPVPEPTPESELADVDPDAAPLR